MRRPRYPPEGIRGVSVSHRANMFGTVPDYFAQSNKNITIIVQIESQQGVDNVDAIAATEGVDGIFVGPSDLAAALGHLGNASHPEVQKAIQHIFARAKAHGKPSGILAPVDADAVAIWNGGPRLLLSAATWACSVPPRRNWLIPLRNNHHRNKRDN
ncbi:alpha-dehydro-beta-deoxy-D-glucarate aldolase [Citrobacter amalonaticus]|nr:alpha-dehydro-beta-deoxy-D-glucarate aldolase [Citrobacter amalonaticus]